MAAGPSIERSTWLSAAKLTTASGRCSASRRSIRSRSPMSPWTKTCAGLSFSDASVSRLPAYVRASRLTTRTPLATASSTKLPPMKPAPPVTSQVGTLELIGILGGTGETVARPAAAAMRPGKHGNRHEPEIRDRRLRDGPWIVGQSRLPPNVDGVDRKRKRSEEHKSELQSLISRSECSVVFKKTNKQ